MVHGRFFILGMRRLTLRSAWLSAMFIGFAGMLGGCVDDTCEPEGELFAETTQLGTIALDEEQVYWTSLSRSEGQQAGEIWRKAKAGGEPERIYLGAVDPIFPFPVLTVDATHVYWLETSCRTRLGDACAEVRRTPKAGGPIQTLVRDDIYAFAVDGDTVFYTTSQERQRDVTSSGPSLHGAVWSMPKDGSAAPVELASDLVELRGLAVDATHVYFLANRGPQEGSAGKEAWLSRIPKAGGTVETAALASLRPEPFLMTDEKLVFSQGNFIYQVNKGDPTPVLVKLDSEESVNSFALAGDTVYFEDEGHYEGSVLDDDASNYVCGAIRSVSVEGQVAKTFSKEEIRPHSLITDGTTLYWAGGSNNSSVTAIRRSKL